MSAHEWLRPKLSALVAEAEQAGFKRDVSVAVITDLINGPLSAPVPPPNDANPNKDIGEPDYMANGASGAHPSLPEEPAGGVRSPLDHLGHHSGYGGSRL